MNRVLAVNPEDLTVTVQAGELVKAGAIGLATTHDLAIGEIVDRLAPRAANVHFEDQFAEGTLRFDYRLRPGIVRSSNAIALMRSIGLEV